MRVSLKFFILAIVFLSSSHLSENSLTTGITEASPQLVPSMQYPVSSYMPSFFPPHYPQYYPSPEYRPNFYPPALGYYPQVPDRKLINSQVEETKKTEEVLEMPPKKSWWQTDHSSILNEIITAEKPKILELKPNIEITKTEKPKERNLRQLTLKQKALAKFLGPYLQQLKTKEYESLEEYHSSFNTFFKEDQQFFESNFWPTVASNFKENRKPHLKSSKVENQMANKIFEINFERIEPSFIRRIQKPVNHVSQIPKGRLSNFLHKLAVQQAGSADGFDSLNGFQLRPDFESKYDLLMAIYKAENDMFKNHMSRKSIILTLNKFDIQNYNQFKQVTQKTLEYFVGVAGHYRLQKKNIHNKEFKRIMKNVQMMVKTIRNKLLGLFFYKYIHKFNELKIRRNNPTLNQRQTLKLSIAKLIDEIGFEKYSSATFRVIKQINSFTRMKPTELSQSPSSFPIFEQIFENQIKSGSLRFLLTFYFQNLFDKITNIENLIFMDDSRLMGTLRFDFRRLLTDFVNDFDLRSFQEFNQVVNVVSRQIDVVFRKSPVTPNKNYFGQFISVYSKMIFRILGKYFYLEKHAQDFSTFAVAHEIPREFYPENYSLLTHQANPIITKPLKPKVRISQELQKAIFKLNNYLENPEGVVFSSEIEREKALSLITTILQTNTAVLSHRTFKVANRLREKLTRMSKTNEEKIRFQAQKINIEKSVLDFRMRLKSINPLKIGSASNFRVSIKFLEDSAIVTKLLISIFGNNNKFENSVFLKLTLPFLETHLIQARLDFQLDKLYTASNIYTKHFEELFLENDFKQAKGFWKVLMRFYSRDCHIELYKLLTTKIVLMKSDPVFEKIKLRRFKTILINLMLFLTKNQNFDLRKDCSEAAMIITRKRLVNEAILKRTFMLNSFKKMFIKVGEAGKRKGENDLSNLILRIRGNSHSILRKSKQHEIAAEKYPQLASGGKQLPMGPPEKRDSPNSIIEISMKKKKVCKKKPPKNDHPILSGRPTRKMIIRLFQMYLGSYGSSLVFEPDFDWNGIFGKLQDGDLKFLISVLKKYKNNVSKISDEKNLQIIMELRRLLYVIKPPISTPPENEDKPECPEKPKLDQQSLSYASSMVQAFYKTFSKHNNIPISHKRIKFKLSNQLFSYFVKLSKKYPQTPPAQIIERHPRIFGKMQKSLFFVNPPVKKPEIPKASFADFSKSVLLKYFKDKLKKGYPNPQLLAKILFKPGNQKLKSYLNVLYKTPGRPVSPPVIDKILKQTELKFYNSIIQHFYKNTDYLKFKPDAKKINARVFFKYLPRPKRQYLHRLYHTFGGLAVFLKKGPVSKINHLIQRVQFKAGKVCKTTCEGKCFKIINGEKIELTKEEKIKYGANSPCDKTMADLRLFDGQGNVVPSAETALYGCGCNCGGGSGGVQINESPIINFNLNLENAEEIKDFEKFLSESDFVTKIKDSNAVDLKRLKQKYQTSNLEGQFEVNLIHKQKVFEEAEPNSVFNPGNPEDEFINQDFMTPDSIGDYSDIKFSTQQINPEQDFLTPDSLGLNHFGENIRSNKKKEMQQKQTIHPNDLNPKLRDGSLKIPFLFGINSSGRIEPVENEPVEGKSKEYYLLKQKRPVPIVENSNAQYPFFYPESDRLMANSVDKRGVEGWGPFQQTLERRYPLNAQNFPVRRFNTPHNFGDLEKMRRMNNKRII